MALKLSDIHADDIEDIGGPGTKIGAAPKTGLSLSSLEAEGEPIEHIEHYIDPKTSAITALATGAIQGAVPFAAPIAGAGRAAMNAITGITGPLGGGNLSDIVEDYRRGRDQFTSDVNTSALANPATAIAGNLAGGIVNPIFKAATSLPKAVVGAAAQGLGQGEADLTRGEIGKAAQDIGYSALGGGVGYGVGKALPKLWEGTKYFGKKALTTLGPSEEAINARLTGKAQDTAKNYSQIAEDMGASLKNLQKQIIDSSDAAKNTLSSEPNIPRAYVDKALDDAKKSLGFKGKLVANAEGEAPRILVGSTDKEAASVLDALHADIKSLGDNVSQQDLKTLIQKMDDNINWDDQSRNKLNNLLKGIRQEFDEKLKGDNKIYKAAMKPVAERVSLLEDLKKMFNFKHVPGEGLQPTDTTATKIQTSLRDNKAVTQKALVGKLQELEAGTVGPQNKEFGLQDFTDQDFLAAAKDFQLANQFSKTAPNGSRRTVLGGAIGGLLGAGSPGTIGIGAAAGATLDRYGGQALGKMIDEYVKLGNTKAFGKFAPLITKASQQGPRALAVTGSLLSKNPEFRAIIDSLKPIEQ